MPQLIQFAASAKAQQVIAEACASKPTPLGFLNASGDAPAELLVYGEIGNPYEASDARSIGQFLRANKGKAVHVRINSPGGLAFDGITIHNALVSHDGPVTTTIEGIAASAASIIAVAGRPTRMFENSTFMMHRAMGGGYGNRSVMLEMADILEKIDDGLASTYVTKTGKSKAQILKLMDGKVDGTWLTAKEAKSMGFVDEIVRAGDKATARLPEAMVRQAKREDARREFLAKAK